MTDSLPKRGIRDRLLNTPRSRAMEAELEAVEVFLAELSLNHENFMIETAEGGRVPMTEALANVDMMLDAKGWSPIWEYDDIAGLTLRQVKEASQQIRELLVGNPFIQNGARVRLAHVLGAGVEFSCRNRTQNQEPKPMPAAMQNLMEEPWAVRYLFGNVARGEMERSAFADGNFLVLGQDATKRMQRVQVQEITGYLRNPNNSEEIWAYRRTWNPNPQRTDVIPNVTNPEPDSATHRTRWYYTDMFPEEERRGLIRFEGKDERAEIGYTIIDMGFNRQVGWPLGVPDALAVVAWSRLYKEFMVNGYVMSRSLARLAFKLTLGGRKTKDKAAEVSRPGQAGSTFLEGEGNQFTPLATAGKGYDFSSGDGLARAMAAGLGISLRALLSDPEKGSTENFMVDTVAKASAAVRRGEWDDFYARLFRWMGLSKRLIVTWRDHNDDTIARVMQAWTLADQTEVLGPEVMQRGIAMVLDIADPGPVPEGWKPFSKRRGSSENGTLGKSGSTAGTGQGADDGTGNSGNDTRDQ
jgi:hypothetical protein